MKKSHRTVAPQKPLPPVRACIFHVNGLLLNPEDIYTEIFREALRENVGAHLPPVPWTITALRKSTGRSGSQHLLQWADSLDSPDFEQEILAGKTVEVENVLRKLGEERQGTEIKKVSNESKNSKDENSKNKSGRREWTRRLKGARLTAAATLG
ncbi:MAG: hypothetical protein LQ344_007427 [Seirophora lacunosa]|nr:MAG: hypothetical protein LQ344_007427 [Seirophora lacunosa]